MYVLTIPHQLTPTLIWMSTEEVIDAAHQFADRLGGTWQYNVFSSLEDAKLAFDIVPPKLADLLRTGPALEFDLGSGHPQFFALSEAPISNLDWAMRVLDHSDYLVKGFEQEEQLREFAQSYSGHRSVEVKELVGRAQ